MHYKDNKLKTIGPQSAHLITTLYEQNKPIFRLKEVRKILHLNEVTSSNFVKKLVDRGIATRLKPGLFILVPLEMGKESEYTGNPLIVAREIMSGADYYLSYATAMEIHGMVTQPQLVFYITTLKPHRPMRSHSVEFRFIHSYKKYFFGLFEHWVTKQEKVKASDLERTIIDCLKLPEYCGGLTEVAKGLWIRRQDIDIKRIIKYAVKLNIGAVTSRLGFLLELYKIGTPEDWELLSPHLTKSYVRLDPLLLSEGKYLRKWRLQLNVSPEELLSIVKT
jgi:predicted transcriptional regulator of viral defense system